MTNLDTALRLIGHPRPRHDDMAPSGDVAARLIADIGERMREAVERMECDLARCAEENREQIERNKRMLEG